MDQHASSQNDEPTRSAELSRRRFLGAAGAAGSAAAAAAMLGSGRAAASTRPDRPRGTRQPLVRTEQSGTIPAPGAGLVGATVIPTGSTTRITAADNFNNNLNPPFSPLSRPLATTVQKYYFDQGDFPTSIPPDAAALLNAGCKLILCYKPAYGGGDKSNLTNSLKAMQGINADVVLWQEVQNPANDISASDFASIMTDYAPIVADAGFPLVYDAGYGQGADVIQTYYNKAAPALSALGLSFAEIAVDLYANQYWGTYNFDLSVPTQIADGTSPPTPLGVLEFGVTISGEGIPSYIEILSFYQYLLQTMTTRLVNGLPNGDVIYYDLNGGTGDIATDTDYAISSLQTMFDSLSSTSDVTTP
jgi:hypothetical protein